MERCDCPLAFSWLPFIPNHIFSRLSFLLGQHLFCSFGFGLFFVVDLLLHLNLVSFPVSPVFSRQYNPSFAALHYCFVAISIHLCSLFHPSRMRLSVPVDCLFSETDFTWFVFFFQPFQVFFSDSAPDSDEINARRQLKCEKCLPSRSNSDPPFTSSSSDDEAYLQALQQVEGKSSSGLQFQLTPYALHHCPSFGDTWQTLTLFTLARSTHPSRRPRGRGGRPGTSHVIGKTTIICRSIWGPTVSLSIIEYFKH